MGKAIGNDNYKYLFFEFARLKDSCKEIDDCDIENRIDNIRQLIIESNLSLCNAFARGYCKKFNRFNDYADIRSECIVALVEAVDKYDYSSNNEFSTLAYKFMEMRMYNLFCKEKRDMITHIDVSINDLEDFDNEIGCQEQLYDEDEMAYYENLDRKGIINDIYIYLDNYPNKLHKELFIMFYGLGQEQRYTERYLSSKFGLSTTTIANAIAKVKTGVSEMLAKNYPLSFPQLHSDYLKKSFMRDTFNRADRRNYILRNYYGIDGEKKTIQELACELDLSVHTVGDIIKRYPSFGQVASNKLSEEEKDNIYQTSEKSRDEMIFNMYFGLGDKVYSLKDICEKIGLSNASYITLLLNTYVENGISKGIFDEEYISQLRERRDKELQKNKFSQFLYEYKSYNGIGGLPKKTQYALSKEIKLTPSGIGQRIERMSKFLETLDAEERDEFLEIKDKEI